MNITAKHRDEKIAARIAALEGERNAALADAVVLREVLESARQALRQEHGPRDHEPECYLCGQYSAICAALATPNPAAELIARKAAALDQIEAWFKSDWPYVEVQVWRVGGAALIRPCVSGASDPATGLFIADTLLEAIEAAKEHA